MTRIEITHHKRAGREAKKPYLAFLRADGHGGVRREFVKPQKSGSNRQYFVADLVSGDVIEFRHTYWGGRSRTTLVAKPSLPPHAHEIARALGLATTVAGYHVHAEGGTFWIALIGQHLQLITRDQALTLARRPRLAGEIAESDLPAPCTPEPMLAGVRFLRPCHA